MSGRESLRASNRLLVRRLLFMTVAMFGFGFAMVPIYDVFCDITGFNGKTGVVQAKDVGAADMERTVTVEFLATTNSDLNWEIRPLQKSMKIHPGAIYEVSYYAKNLSDTSSVGQAVPSVTPSKGSLYFNKTECFCFTRQLFEAGEGRAMPVRFVVDEDLPAEISTLTLSYTFFDVSESG